MVEAWFWTALGVTGVCTALMSGFGWYELRRDRRLREHHGLPRRR